MKKYLIIIVTCLLVWIPSGLTPSYGQEPGGTAYVPAHSVKDAVSHYITAVENNVKTYQYETRVIDHRYVPMDIPILMFHHISTAQNAVLTPDSFRRYMVELAENQYETISYDQLYAFVQGETDLPDKPILITFDDGYLSNYEYAYPILKGLGMKAEISVVGCTVGKDTHPETGKPIIPHFSWEQAKEMVDSGVMGIHSHSYDLHQHNSAEDVKRVGVMRNEYEPDSLYATIFSGDGKRMKQLIQEHLGYDDLVFTYPYGKFNTNTERILSNLQYRITVTTDVGINKVRIGYPASLREMKRIPCDTNGIVSMVDRINAFLSKR